MTEDLDRARAALEQVSDGDPGTRVVALEAAAEALDAALLATR